ncbi:MAG: efflux RND transporter permease subunit [Haliscomenobacteraceae bacterium CHB4]|nr:Efflux pump membrane transporter BepE [Saprospiraceae bacterium]MCE7924103.1 efflux RND transporter permease subunit [Haliscomenobacteraceae bacterium CHB4]
MNLPDLSLRRPVLATVMSILIVFFGAVGYGFLGVREYPAIDPPNITVRTNYTGANAEVVESQITEPLEKAINGIAGIRTISSSSALGNSNITVEFDLDVDLEQAANDVRDKVSQALRSLPQDIDAPPVVTKADASGDPIMFIPIQSSTRNIMELSDYAENVIMEKIQTIPGVSAVNIFGQKRTSMRLWIDPAKLVAFNLTVQDIQAALDRENVELPGGKVRGDVTEMTVKTFGRLLTEEDFNNMIVRQTEGQTIRFRDIGEAMVGPENEETGARRNLVQGVSLAIIPQPGSNWVEITDEFYRRYEQIQKELPSDIIMNVGIDKSRFVRRAVSEVQETLFIAIGLVVLIIYLFFRNWLIALRPLIDIPVSLIGAFFIMYVFGFSINVLTLLAIVLATGLVVDDGIVVTENIFKKIEAGMDKWTAAREGTKEIFFAVISTSITLAVVFIPVIFLQGFTGRLFREFGIVVAGAVLISAFVSLTLTPVLNVKLGTARHGWFYNFTEPFFKGMDRVYGSALRSFMRYRWASLAILAGCFGMIWYFGGTVKSELAPLEDRSRVRSNVSAPEGTDFDQMESIIYNLCKMTMDSVPETEMIFGVTAPGFGAASTNSGFLSLALTDPDKRERTQDEIYNQLLAMYKRVPDARVFPTQEETISIGFGRGLPVQFVLQTLDFEKLKEVVPKFLEEARKDPAFATVDVNLKFNKPELQITIDRLKAAELGVSVFDVSSTLQMALSGRRFGYFLKDGKQYQVIGQVDRANRDEPLDLAGLYVRNNRGDMIQLDNIVRMEETSNPPQLYHHNRYKSATISAGLAPGKTLGEGIEAMEAIAGRLLDDTFETDLSGASRDFRESSGNTMFAFLLALGLIYLILAAQFESFRDPFIIMLTVPLAIAGAFLTLAVTGNTLNIFSQIGMIMLIGLVTKNGILIVEFANQKRDAGMPKRQAVLEAAQARLRPILMTTLATVLGALPIALAFGAASTSRIPLGMVVVGGLLFSLLLTLFVIPAMYTFLSGKQRHHAPWAYEEETGNGQTEVKKEPEMEGV